MVDGTEYPHRGKGFFVTRFMAHVLRSAVGLHCGGGDAVTLLFAVVLTEDKVRYKRPVTFWNDQLMAYIGCNERRLASVRDRLVDEGWLHYEAGRKSHPGIYWVLVPGGDEMINDSILGTNEPILTSKNDGQTSVKQPVKLPSNSRLFIPIPIPDPIPLKPIGDRVSKKFRLWKNAKREEFSDPKTVQRVYDLALNAGICTEDERLHVFRLVASLVQTTDKSDNLPGLLTAVLRGDAGHDPWRARGIDCEDTARSWIRSVDVPAEMQQRTGDLLGSENGHAERAKQISDLKTWQASRGKQQ